MKLNQSKVVFDPIAHTYTLNGVTLRGVTSVIREKLFPDEYAAVSEEVLNNAAERGHRIHSAFELYDTASIITDNCNELTNYIAERMENAVLLNHEASEYLVSDLRQYASCIDKVFADPNDTTGVIIADVKTTYNLKKEYVSWQLSIYADFFEAQNPELHVTHLYALWFRDDKHKVIEVERKSHEQVAELLYGTSEIKRTDEATATTLPAIADAEEKLIELKRQADEYAAKYDELKQGLLSIMQQSGVKKYESERIILTHKADTTRETFDSKTFRAEHADLYKQYVKSSVTKGGIIIKIK